MNHSTEEAYQRRIAELESENVRLTKSLEFVKADRKALRDEVYGPVKIEKLTTEEEYLERLQNHVPGSAMKFLEELGLTPRKPS